MLKTTPRNKAGKAIGTREEVVGLAQGENREDTLRSVEEVRFTS